MVRPPDRKPDAPQGTIYFEFHPIGAQVRVAAIDAATGVEVVIFGPASTPQNRLEALAAQKLRRRLSQGGG